MKCLILIVGLVLPVASFAQYSLDWHTIDGGGGASTGGAFSLAGTIGQPDAGESSGGPYSLVGGFWGMTVVSTPVVPPLLAIAKAGQTVVVSWPRPADGFVLDQTTALASVPASTSWSLVPAATYQTNATHIFITVPMPSGSKFYQLRRL